MVWLPHQHAAVAALDGGHAALVCNFALETEAWIGAGGRWPSDAALASLMPSHLAAENVGQEVGFKFSIAEVTVSILITGAADLF